MHLIKYIGIIFLLFIQFSTFSQNMIITGKVIDREGSPLWGVKIFQNNSSTCSYSDFDGIFHILINDTIEKKIHLSKNTYHSVLIKNLDTINDILIIKLEKDPNYKKKYKNDSQLNNKSKKTNFGALYYIKVDFIFNDFNDFENILPEHYIDLMNKSNGVITSELAVSYKKFYWSLSCGFKLDDISDNDTLNIEFNTSQYGIHFGYNLFNNKHLLLTPKVAIKWSRYRLLQNEKQNSIPIEQYIDKRDLDLRFNQLTGFLGLNISYKFHNYSELSNRSFSMGLYGGYAFKVHNNPFIYSRGNRLVSPSIINIKNYNIGILFSLILG